MFTGLIERLGVVDQIYDDGGRQFTISVPDREFLGDARIGDSIAISGVCLTATDINDDAFAVTAVEETLRRTSLGDRVIGDAVNLERALRADARLGGHIVQGHVDGVADVVGVRGEGESSWITFQPPFGLMRYIVEKGSICLDGVSLTVANVAYNKFSIALIPHTRAHTTADSWGPGARVNVEVDIIAKYVERLTKYTRGEQREEDA